VALIPEETVTQVSFENAIMVHNLSSLHPFFTNSWFRPSTAACGVSWSTNDACLLALAHLVPTASKSGSVFATTTSHSRRSWTSTPASPPMSSRPTIVRVYIQFSS
jgi:hypothetical protein